MAKRNLKRKNANKIVIINKGNRAHHVGGVTLFPGQNKVDKESKEDIEKHINAIEESGRESTADMLRADLKLDNPIEVEKKGGEFNYDIADMKRAEIKDLISETFNEDEIYSIDDLFRDVEEVKGGCNKQSRIVCGWVGDIHE